MPINFQRLIIDQEGVFRLDFKLDDLMGKEENKYRREYLQCAFLRIELDEYDCTVCQSREEDGTVQKNNDLFSRAIWNLTSILSKWTGLAKRETVRNQRPEGIGLESGIYSPSDCKHAFQDIHFKNRNSQRIVIDGLNDPYHGWLDGRRVIAVGLEPKQKITGKLKIDPNGRHFVGPPNKVLEEDDRPKRRDFWLP